MHCNEEVDGIAFDLATFILAGLAIFLAARHIIPQLRADAGSDNADPVKVESWEEVTAVGNRIGPAQASVTIVEFGDYQCPACRRMFHTLEYVLGMYPQEVALVYRHWPLAYHGLAYPAARAAECAADQGRFAEYNRELYTNPSWFARPDATFRALAAKVGMADTEAFADCINEIDPHPNIERDRAAAEELGGTGTPTLIINGFRLRHLPDTTELRGMVRRLLSDESY